VSYHVALEITQEQVKSLKLLATSQDTTVKSFVSDLVKKAIENKKEETEK